VSISEPPLDLGFRGWSNTWRGDGSSGPGCPHHRAAQPGAGPRPWWWGCPVAPLTSSFWLL
jgi:hypothetical protein